MRSFGMNSTSSGSKFPFAVWQRRQAGTTLPTQLAPPRLTGTKWSRLSNGPLQKAQCQLETIPERGLTAELIVLEFISTGMVSAKKGKAALVLIWDNASWHKSQAVRSWLREHNQTVKQSGACVRILPCLLPVFDSPIVYSVLVSKFAEAA